MKMLFFAFILLLGFNSISSIQAQTSSVTSSEETSIKKTIEEDTQGFMTRDEQKWSDAWVHAPYVSWSSERSPMKLLGWDNMRQAFTYNFVSGQPDRATVNFQRDNYTVNILDKIATATFIQIAKNADGKPLVL